MVPEYSVHFLYLDRGFVILYSVPIVPTTFIVLQIFLLIFIILRRGTGNITGKEIKQMLAVRIGEPHFVGILGFSRREKQRKPAFTVHHKGFTNNIYFLF